MANFSAQIEYVFQRPVREQAWYWEIQEEGDDDVFNADDPLTAFEFIEQLCQNPGIILKPYTDDQVGLGLEFIFNNACSNLTHSFKAAAVEHHRKVEALRSLSKLFKEVLEPRCASETQAGSNIKAGVLPSICYMFWDVCPLSGHWSDVSKAERRDYYEAVAEVMAKCLKSSNLACVESGLHGLGHMVAEYPVVAEPILDQYLKNSGKIPSAVLNYAKAARTGNIQ